MAKTSKKREILEAELAAALSKPGINGVIHDPEAAPPGSWDANGAPVEAAPVKLPEPEPYPRTTGYASGHVYPTPRDVAGVNADGSPVPSLLRARVRSGLREYRAGAGWTRNAETAEARASWELGPGEWTLTREQARVPDVESHGVLTADARALEAARDLQTARRCTLECDALILRCELRLARALEAAERASAPRGDE